MEQWLERATAWHREGHFAEARTIYQQILAQQPGATLALFRSGLLELQVGEPQAAYRLIGAAVAAAPEEPRYRLGLGHVAEKLGLWTEAASAYEAAIARQHDDAETYNLLGNCHRRRGAAGPAAAAYRRALELQPDSADAMSNLGSLLRERGDTDAALALLRGAVALRPAVSAYAVNLGITLCQRHEFAEAEAVLRAVAERDPHDAEAAFNLAVALRGSGSLRAAADQHRRAIAIRPDYTDALINLGNVCKELGEYTQAAAAYDGALGTRPNSVEAINNAGCLLRTLGRLDEAEAHLRDGLQLDGGHATLHDNLGNVLKDAGELDQAIDEYREALQIDPQRAVTHSNLCYALGFQCAGPAPILEECRRWNERFAAGLWDRAAGFANTREPGRPLRIGYVSADFRDHCQSLFMLPLLARHDRASFEIFCYSSVERADDFTPRARALTDAWRDVRMLDDAALANLIRADRIDILVDLSMHMAGGRPLVFARKPAPLQVAWLAYPGTTGIEAIDYRLSDARLDPPGSDANYTERTVRLADSFWCYDPLTDQPDVNVLPALQRGYVTFGCLNNPCKFTEATLRLWSRALQALPAAKLLLMAPTGLHRLRLRERLLAHGISVERVGFVPFRPRAEYLQTYHQIDVGLDTFPYNGHTTSLDALWMGVPVITLVGQTCVGRGGLSQLTQLGLPELAAGSEEAFFRAALDLGSDLPRLAALRQSLRARLQASPLMDGERFARQIEAAYREIWTDYCRRNSSDVVP
ncbi:MAG: tetratricopeptide repeat protein [Steroidobacterales bacterium]